jgi:predicted acylesterase/phospholipase RssA
MAGKTESIYYTNSRFSKQLSQTTHASIELSLAMPISGAKFANQIGICLHLLLCGYQPDVIMGTSGGCITGALLVACGVGNIKCQESYIEFRNKLNNILSQLDHTHYRTAWSDVAVFNTIQAIAYGSLYNSGAGPTFIDPASINIKHQPELWIGTHCKDTGQSQLFCTKPQRQSIIQMSDAIYLNNKIPDILMCAIASSAVPSIIPPIKRKGYSYCDGGISYASPLGPCMSAFDAKQLSYHVIYISAVRYNSADDPSTAEIEDDDVWNKISSSTAGMVTGLHIADRNNGIRAVGKDPIKEIGCGKNFLKKCLRKQRRASRSFIELAPLKGVHINFLQMKQGDALKAVNEAYDNGFSVRHWYLM